MPSLEKIARTIAELAAPGMQPETLFQAVRERLPKASKKQIRIAAFYALILVAEANPDKVTELHDLVLRTRQGSGSDGE